MLKFINRTRELKFLEVAWRRRDAQLLVVYGRRRVGKTALLRRFADGRIAVHYVATRLPESQQLREIGQTLGAAVGDALLADTGFTDWQQVFDYLERQPRRIVFILDEFPYLVEANSALPSLWQRSWDLQLSDSKVVVVLCGSSIAMMEREVLMEGAPLFGRRTGQLRLQPLGFSDAAQFFPRYGFEDAMRSFAVLGGTPHYLQLFDDRRRVLANVRETVLDVGAPLRDEVDFLLRQELREPRVYFGILSAVAAGKRRLSEIVNATGLSHPTITKYLAVLQDLGFVEREVPVTEKRPEKSKKGLYRIVDPFVHFWMEFVLAQRGLLETGRIDDATRRVHQELDQITAPAYEEICRKSVKAGLLDEITGVQWTRVGRWWDRNREIDFVGFTEDRRHALFGEVKWSRRPVGTNILRGLEEASSSVELSPDAGPRRFALFSRSGFTDAVHREHQNRDDLTIVHGLDAIERPQ